MGEKTKTGCIGCGAAMLVFTLLLVAAGVAIYEIGTAQLEEMKPVITDAMGRVVADYQDAQHATPEGIALMEKVQALVQSPETSVSSATLGLAMSSVVNRSDLNLNDKQRALMEEAIAFMEKRPDASLMDISGFVQEHPELQEPFQRLQRVYTQEGFFDGDALDKVLRLPPPPTE